MNEELVVKETEEDEEDEEFDYWKLSNVIELDENAYKPLHYEFYGNDILPNKKLTILGLEVDLGKICWQEVPTTNGRKQDYFKYNLALNQVLPFALQNETVYMKILDEVCICIDFDFYKQKSIMRYVLEVKEEYKK